jgi:hypothetical protein
VSDKNPRVASIAFPHVNIVAICFKESDQVLVFDIETLQLRSRIQVAGNIKLGTFSYPNNHWLLISAHDKRTEMKNGVRFLTIMIFDTRSGSFLDVDMSCQASDVHAFGDRYLSMFLGDNQTGFEVRDVVNNNVIRMTPKSGDKHFSHEICALGNDWFATQVWGKKKGVAIFNFTTKGKFRIISQQNIMHFIPLDAPHLATLQSTETDCSIMIWNYETLTMLREFSCSYSAGAKLCYLSSRSFELLLVHSDDDVLMERWNYRKGECLEALPRHDFARDCVTRWASDVRGDVVGILGEQLLIYRFAHGSGDLKSHLGEKLSTGELADIVIVNTPSVNT